MHKNFDTGYVDIEMFKWHRYKKQHFAYSKFRVELTLKAVAELNWDALILHLRFYVGMDSTVIKYAIICHWSPTTHISYWLENIGFWNGTYFWLNDTDISYLGGIYT